MKTLKEVEAEFNSTSARANQLKIELEKSQRELLKLEGEYRVIKSMEDESKKGDSLIEEAIDEVKKEDK